MSKYEQVEELTNKLLESSSDSEEYGNLANNLFNFLMDNFSANNLSSYQEEVDKLFSEEVPSINSEEAKQLPEAVYPLLVVRTLLKATSESANAANAITSQEGWVRFCDTYQEILLKEGV